MRSNSPSRRARRRNTSRRSTSDTRACQQEIDVIARSRDRRRVEHAGRGALRALAVGARRAAGAAEAPRARLAGRRRPGRHRARPVDRQRRVPARSGGVRAPRPVAAVGHDGRRRAADHLQHGGDALHAGDGRAGVHRLHAHAALVDAAGRWSTRRCTCCRSAGRHSPVLRPGRCSSWRRARLPGPDDAAAIYCDRRRRCFWPACCVLLGRARASCARSRSSTGCSSRRIARRLSDHGADLRARRRRGCRAVAGLAGFDLAGRPVRVLSGGRRSRPAGRAGRVLRVPAASAISCCRTGRATRATAWGSAPATSRRRSAGTRSTSPHTGFMFAPDADAMRRWQGWWRIVRVDQWGVFACRRDARHAAAGACCT